MSTFPSVFISHGSPDLPLRSSPALDFLKQLGKHLGKPKAILAISAHWLTSVPTVNISPKAKAIYDFGGFQKEVYQLNYAPLGSPELAHQVSQQLSLAGFEVDSHPTRGLDHGAWEPLLLMYPDADIPVIQLSIQPRLGSKYHLLLGQALTSFRQQGILILASGTATHNLGAFGQYPFNASPPDWVKAFDDWLATAIACNDIDALVEYRHQGPYAVQNHPSEEHYLPLLVALGAGGEHSKGTQLHSSFTYGVFSMAAYAFS